MVRIDQQGVDKGRRYVRRRGSGAGVGMAAGGGGILVLILTLLFGGDVLGGAGGGGLATPGAGGSEVVDQDVCDEGETEKLLCFVMGDLNETWEAKFAEYGQPYEPALLNIFVRSVTTNGCGSASSAVGPFYCPAPQDQQVYLDLGFFNELAGRNFGAPGDFAQVYVIAHEVGHHISNISGDAQRIRDGQQANPSQSNGLQILLELQADCYAGVWASSASQRTLESNGLPIIEPGDLEEGLQAAAAVGDDRIQERMTGQIEPHKWTHGSANQRQTAFRQGFLGEEVESCSLETMEAVTQQA